jgi:hypothetical protein
LSPTGGRRYRRSRDRLRRRPSLTGRPEVDAPPTPRGRRVDDAEVRDELPEDLNVSEFVGPTSSRTTTVGGFRGTST